MGDAEAALPPSKKRVAGRQLSKDDPDPDDDVPEPEMGTFRKASEGVIATRRIVKVQRNQPPPAASSNPFAGIRLVAPVDSGAQATNPIDLPETGGYTTPIGEPNDTNDNSVITDVGKGTEIRDSDNITEGTEESNRKGDEKSEPSSAIGEDTVQNDEIEEKTQPVEIEEKPQPVETSEESKKGGKKTDSETREETNGDHVEENEKEAKETKEEAGGNSENALEDSEKEVQENDQKDPAVPAAPVSSFQQLSSSQNAFSGLAGTGFSTSSLAFAPFSKQGPTFGTNSASPFAFISENSLFSFGTGSAVNGESSLPSLGTTPDASKSVKLSMQEVPVETGEENEKAVFTADAIMYEYLDGGWKERGKGELKLNVSVSDAEKARLVMRAKGNYRLILNASLYSDMSLTNMDKRGITFACVNSAGDGKDDLTTVALKFKDSSIVQEFRQSVIAHKGKKAATSEPSKDSSKESDN